MDSCERRTFSCARIILLRPPLIRRNSKLRWNMEKEDIMALVKKVKDLNYAVQKADEMMLKMKADELCTDYVVLVGTRAGGKDKERVLKTGAICTSVDGLASLMASGICSMAERQGVPVEHIWDVLRDETFKCMKMVKEAKEHQKEMDDFERWMDK